MKHMLVCVVWGRRAVRGGRRLTGDGAADLAPAGADAGAVPDHAVLGSLVGFSHGVVLLVDLIVAPLLGYAQKLVLMTQK